ncbi:hypothetical protein V8E54_008129 [Elaphomyces granulatus]
MMSDIIRPDSIPGFNAVGLMTGTTAALEGKEFLIHCPPDLPMRSRVVSVCGITDWCNAAKAGLSAPISPDPSNNYLNVTAVVAASKNEKSHSWPVSKSVGRLRHSGMPVDVEEAPEEATQHRPTSSSARIHFSAENDEWEMNYKSRLGLPLVSFKTRWESLRAIPPTTAAEGNARRRRLQVLAREYFAAKSGPDNACSHSVKYLFML